MRRFMSLSPKFLRVGDDRRIMKIVTASIFDCPASQARRELERGQMGQRLFGVVVVTQITIRPLSNRGCLYQEEVELDAGPFTALVAFGLRGFLRLRQRALARSWGERTPVEW